MKIQTAIAEKLTHAFAPQHLEVINESHMHSVPKNSETHFLVILISDQFESLTRVERAQKVHETLKNELKNGVYALSTRLWTTQEWNQKNQQNSTPSPQCHSKK